MTKAKMTIGDLKCCANCLNYQRDNEYDEIKEICICMKGHIHKDLIQSWKVCEYWEWDGAGFIGKGERGYRGLIRGKRKAEGEDEKEE